MPIPLENPDQYAEVRSFTPDRLWVRQLSITLESTTKYSVRAVPCPGTATELGAVNLPEISSPDLGAELAAAPDSADKVAALAALQRLVADIPTVFAFLRSLRG